MGHVFGRLIAFDLDGTIIDSSRDLAGSVNDLLAELGAAPLPLDSIVRMIGNGVGVLVGRALAASGLPGTPAAVARFRAIYDAQLLDSTRPYDGLPDVVRAARAHARVAILTNKPLDATEKILAGLGLRDLFDDVIGGDGPLPPKPDPAGLRALVERAGVAPGHALMVGDSRVDYETARAATTRCCLAAYGPGYHSLDGVATGDASIAADARELAEAIARFIATG